MKKKLASILMAIVCVFAIGFCALACGSESEINGTYTMYTLEGQKAQMTYVFEDGDLTMKMGTRVVGEGTYSVSGKEVTLKSGNAATTGTIVSDGIIKFENDNTGFYLCIEGKTPPTEETDE